MRSVLAVLSLALLAAGCDNKKPDTASPISSTTSKSATMPVPSATMTTAEPAKAKAADPIFKTTGFKTPESVFYDAEGDRYLVSNINGKPTEADGNGYISVMSPEGKVTTEKWIEGGKNKVTLNAPKGMAVSAGMLYVADLDTVRTFDMKTGAPKGDIKIPGATFLNDVATSMDGKKVYVSDSGVKTNAKGDFEGTGTDAVWVIEGGKPKTVAKAAELGRPNGIFVDAKGVWVNTFGTNELYRLDDAGKRQDVTKLPKGTLDGIFAVKDTFYVSSWDSSSIYKGKVGGTFEVAFENVKSPADICLDTKRNRLLVPLFMENEVRAYDLGK